MKPRFKVVVAVALVVSLIGIQPSFCGEPSDHGLNKWKCRCSSFLGNQRHSLANCSESCDCHSDAKESSSKWTCICDRNGFPKVAADGHSNNCFKSCNCTWGTFPSFHLESSVTGASETDFEFYEKTSRFLVTLLFYLGCFQKICFLFGSQKETFYGNIIQFSFAELENATENFSASNLIGLGGSSYVYRGRLKDGSNVAVKKLKDKGRLEDDSEFITEASSLPSRSVGRILLRIKRKTSSKITDLGMAKNLRGDDIAGCPDSPARMQGTFGYFAPEYAIVGRASLESDVFSFGVVLLELISGRQPIHKSAGKEESLVIWASPRLQDSKRVVTELADPRLKGNFPEEEVQIMAYLAKECLLLDPDTRPTMSEVVQILSSISPAKSRMRRSISVSLFEEPENAEKQRQDPSNRFPARHLSNNHNHFAGKENKDVGKVSVEYMDSLVHLSSKAESWPASEEEMVDLTEPKFESFCISNVEIPS
ncbi:unnamed protein product [Lupinus luteus]|uniref:Protein kinase domain-containing protein n=1 Tax=Lupinus luteus TaxID=3873 RepID=A0AAV1YGZ2_LUPLU